MKIKNFSIVALALVIFAVPSFSQDSNHVVSAIGQKVAEAYGIDSFSEISEIKYTFNAQIDDKTISRTWIWLPKENKVSYKANNEDAQRVIYSRDNVSNNSEAIREVDAMFINDQYWLIFPFHLVWDDGIRIEVKDQALDLPLGSGSTTVIRVKYPDTGGYTPGDVYDLYLDDNSMITKWVYRRGGSDTPTRITSWEDNTQFGPITISLNRPGPDGNFRVWFTDVEVR